MYVTAPVTSFGEGSFGGPVRGWRTPRELGSPVSGLGPYGLWLLVNKPAETRGFSGRVRAPGEDPTGASTEREGGFDPQPKGRRARGEYKGAREVLARHGRTAHPWGGPGWVPMTQRTTQPSCMYVLF
jgi:hypothetical protein